MSEVTPALPRGRSRHRGRHIRTSAGRAPHRRLAAVGAWLVRVIGAEVAARRSVRELAGMSERGLNDVGLSRGHVERVARRGRF